MKPEILSDIIQSCIMIIIAHTHTPSSAAQFEGEKKPARVLLNAFLMKLNAILN